MIHQNLVFGVVFSVVLEILAGLGQVAPVLGAILHAVATTVVIFNSARLVRFGEELHVAKPSEAPAHRPKVEPVPAT